mgnify:FL=1
MDFKRLNHIVCAFLVLALISCSNTPQENKRPVVVCTTNIIGDVVRNLVPDSIEVISLMGPGVDPHLYKVTQGDIARLRQADVVIYNGIHLEGKMLDVLSKLKDKMVISAGDSLPHDMLINSTAFAGAHDPHIWFDPLLWLKAINVMEKGLQKAFPAYGDEIGIRYKQYEKLVLETHEECETLIAKIPVNKRIMITAHDAFSYYGHRYHIQVKGLQGISTTAEYGIKDVSELVKFIIENKVPAIFVESSVPKKSIEAVIEGCRSKGHEVKLGGTLYSDALGGKGSGADTYTGMLLTNTKTFVNALVKP